MGTYENKRREEDASITISFTAHITEQIRSTDRLLKRIKAYR